MDRTNSKSDAYLTQPGSRPVRYELTDKDGNSWGFFDTAARAAGFAGRTWPDQEQDPDRTGRGWDVQVCE